MKRKRCDVLEQEFLQVRAKLLEVAAFFDRLDDAEPHTEAGSGMNVQQLERLRTGCELLTDAQSDKAARLQLLFSRQYEPNWRETFEV